MDVQPFDALLLVSFGGPEHPDDVVPFLENVTAGRGIPRERLVEVGEHYFLFGGRSPINDLNRELLDALRKDFAEHGIDLPIYWGNRNWTPMLADTLAAMAADGVRRALVLTTSAYASYSGCRQYREDLAAAQAQVGPGAPEVDKIRHYFNHPGFVAPMVANTVAALAELPEASRAGAVLLFSTHSIPTAMAESAGPGGNAYVTQHQEVAALVAAGVAEATGLVLPSELVYQSRSGPPTIPWLEPDVGDRIDELAKAGARAVVVVPIGFISDHMEVRFDLDVEVREQTALLGLPYARAATVGTAPEFVAAIRDLVLERTGADPRRAAVGVLGPSHDVCPAGCCPNLRAPKPAAAGRD
jgi:ferrochelatase